MTFWLWVSITFWVKFSEFKNKLCFIHYFSHYLKFQDHPIRKHYLVKILPPDIRNKLLFHRKYIFTAFELATRLAFIGVVQFGPQKLKEKDQVRLRNTRITIWSKKCINFSSFISQNKNLNVIYSRYFFTWTPKLLCTTRRALPKDITRWKKRSTQNEASRSTDFRISSNTG